MRIVFAGKTEENGQKSSPKEGMEQLIFSIFLLMGMIYPDPLQNMFMVYWILRMQSC